MIKVELTIRGRVKTEWIKEGWIECCCQSEETKIDNVQIHSESSIMCYNLVQYIHDYDSANQSNEISSHNASHSHTPGANSGR